MRHVACVLYALSSITVLAGAAVAPAMAEIRQAFPDAGSLAIHMIIALPALAVLPASFAADRLCRLFGKKAVLLAGLALYLAGGLGGGLADGMAVMLLCRAVLGIGMGLLTPTAHSLPADFFEGREKMVVVSRMSAFVTMGAALCSIVAGWLALISWRASFGVYLVALPVAVMVLLLLPRVPSRPLPPPAAPPDGPAPVQSRTLPWQVWLLGMSMLLFMASFYLFPLCLAGQLQATGVGDARFAGLVLALISVIGFGTGLLFPRLRARLGLWLLPLLLAALGTGSLLTATASAQATALIGGLLTGFGLGLTTYHYVAVNRRASGPALVRALSVLVAGTFAGQFCSPFLILFLDASAVPGGVFGLNGGLLLAAAGLAAAGALWYRRSGGRPDG